VRVRTLIASGLLFVACDDVAPPRGQWVVTLATDAPIPALGDRVLVEIYDDDGFACSSCRRAFGTADASRWPLSFGVAADSDARRIRARLFRAKTLSEDGTPQTSALIDVLAMLPADPAGVESVTLVLHTECFGIASDVEANTTCDPATKLLQAAPELREVMAPPAAGSWPPAAEKSCATPAPGNMACIPGGVFLLGDPDSPPQPDPLAATIPERLVKVPPFYLDMHEMTVGDFLTLQSQQPALVAPAVKGDDDAREMCAYDPSAIDPAAPLNCVGRDAAETYCQVQGKRLPTEAEWEYAASNGQYEDRYPWGSDDDICARAVVARSNLSLCRITDEGTLNEGPVAGGAAEDVDVWGVFDLGGNVSEWVADSFQGYGAGCWAGNGLLEGPRCADETGRFSVRGGNWDSAPISARSSLRASRDQSFSSRIGVRCALDSL